MNRTHKTIYTLCISCAMAATSFQSCNSNSKDNHPPQPITPLFEELETLGQQDSLTREVMMAQNAKEYQALLSFLGADSLSGNMLAALSESRPVQVFTPDVRQKYPALDSLEMNLGYILGKSADEQLLIPERSYAAVVWGRPESMVFVNDVMLIALNHYLGAGYEGYSALPEYRRMVKSPEFLPYDLAESLVATSYPYTDNKSTVMSHLLYQGALAYAKTRLVKDSKPEMALGYTPEQWQWLNQNESRLWQQLVKDKYLYDTSELTSSKLFDPAPSTNILSANAPGRAGRFLGYKIILSYLNKHPETTLPQLLSPEFYTNQNSLINAEYAP